MGPWAPLGWKENLGSGSSKATVRRQAQRRGGSGGAGRGGQGGAAVALLHRLTETKFLRRCAGSMEKGLARGTRQQGGAAMARPDGPGQGWRLTMEGDARQRRSRA